MDLLLQADAALSNGEVMLDNLLTESIQFGLSVLKAFIIFIVGRYVIKFISKLVKNILVKRDVDPSVRTFLNSLLNVILMILLIISVIGALGVQTASFAALLASAGVAIGMALRGNLSNFAGGLIILIFKPYKVGDYISVSAGSGTVAEIQIFHTVINTSENLRMYVPNGSMSSGYINNYNIEKRRIEWMIGIDYGESFDKVRETILEILAQEKRILPDPLPLIELHTLDASSVNVVVRVWAPASDYWGIYFNINQQIYKTFNEKGINFPYPQLTVHKG